MNGSTWRRVARVLFALLRRPQDIPGYMRHGPWSKRSPLELGLPWISFAAIEYLERFLQPDMKVCEFGSGGSTLYFSRRCAQVVSVEHDDRWIRQLESALLCGGLSNVVLRHAAIPRHAADLAACGYLESPSDLRYDVVLIDLLDDEACLRAECFRFAEQHLVKAGGIIVLDDAWRYPELQQGHRATRRIAFKSVGPCRYGVTTTDVYFY